MNTSINTSMSATNAAIAASYAHEAREAECRIIIKNYDTKTATIKDMQEYAECVNTLYPDKLDPTSIIILKICFSVWHYK